MSHAIALNERESSDDVLNRLVATLPTANPPHVRSFACEQMRLAQVLFELLIHAHADPAVSDPDPEWVQEAINRALGYVKNADDGSDVYGAELWQQVRRVRGLFEVSMYRLRNLAQTPWSRNSMQRWLELMKFEIDTAADDFE